MPVTTNYVPGQQLTAADLNADFAECAAVSSANTFGADQTFDDAINQTASAGANNETPLLNASDVFSDFIASGMQWTLPSPASLTSSMNAGVSYLNGQRTIVPAISSNTFPASSDTYVSFNNSGNANYASVANGATAPTVPSGYVQTAKVVTSPIISPTPTLSASTAAGTLVAGTYEYQLVAYDATGYGLPSTAVSITTTATGEVILTWVNPLNETSMSIYGRVAGSIGLLASGVTGTTWTDTGANSVGAAAPTTATSNAVQGIYPLLRLRPAIRVSVLDYGADPTGNTYSDEAFYAAVNAALALGSTGFVYIPSGQYYLSHNFSPINISQPISIYGDGYSSLIVVESGPANCVFHVTGGAADIRNLKFFGVGQSCHAILADTTVLNGYLFKNISSDGMRGCIKIAIGQVLGGIFDCTAINGFNGFEIDGANTVINGCYALNNSNQGFIFTSINGPSANIVSDGCTSYGNPNGNWIMQGNSTHSITDAVITNLTLSYSANYHCLYMDTYGTGNTISNSYIEFAGGDGAGPYSGFYDGIHITGNNNGQRIHGCTSRFNGNSGIYTDANNTQITGCDCNNNVWYTDTGGSQAGITVDGGATSNILISSTTAINQNKSTAPGVGIYAASTTGGIISSVNSQNGIYFSSFPDGYEISSTPGVSSYTTNQSYVESTLALSSYTTNAPTSGTVNLYMPQQGNGKEVILTFNAYENDTTTAQTINFPVAFSVTPLILGNNTGLTLTASTTGITITAPDSTTTYSGTVAIMGN